MVLVASPCCAPYGSLVRLTEEQMGEKHVTSASDTYRVSILRCER
jgi:hypothetical protein